MLRAPSLRASLVGVVRMFRDRAICIAIVAFLATSLGLLWGASLVGLWNGGLLADTVFWMLGSGIVLLFNFARATERPSFFRASLAELIRVAIFLDVLLEVSILSLPIELLLVPVATLLTMVAAVTERQDQHKQVSKGAQFILALVGLALVSTGLLRLVRHFGGHDYGQLVRQALLPIWLTAGLLPYVYLLGIYARYEVVARHNDWQSSTTSNKGFALKATVLREFGLKGHELGQLNRRAMSAVAQAGNYKEARRQIQLHRQRELHKKDEELRAANRLERFTGVDGFDPNGRRLDRREFETTQRALRWLHACHSGRCEGGRYQRGVLDLVSRPGHSSGLEPGVGYHEVVAADGSSWFAWRRTPSGWVFAIGANESPPNQWLYDGPETPARPPGAGTCWGDSPFGAGSCSRNWD